MLSCLVAMRKIIGFLKISGNILSENYRTDLFECKTQWFRMSCVLYCYPSNGPLDINDEDDDEDDEDEDPAPCDEKYLQPYEENYGEIDYEDEFTKPI